MNFAELLAKGLISFGSDETTYAVGTLAVAALAFLVGSANFYKIFLIEEDTPKAKKIAAFLCDALKGVISVFIGMLLMPADGFSYVAAAFCMAGHAFSPFFRFCGGNCFAVFIGAAALLNPIAALFALVIYAIVIMFSKYASVSAMAAALLFPIINYYFGFSFFSFGGEEASVVLLVNNILRVVVPIFIAVILCVSYAESIKNLISGTEKKI